MKVIILNCFETYQERVELIYKFFEKNFFEVEVIQSDFKHFTKEKRIDIKKNYTWIDTKEYKSNISVKRMKSHYYFAKDAFKLLEEKKPDIIYVIIPPNSLAKFAMKYKKKYDKTKLIIDVMDLWPETFPMKINQNIEPFKYWANMRNKSFLIADYIIFECELYKNILNEKIKEIKNKTVYLAKHGEFEGIEFNIRDNFMEICYLGSINNIIDIDLIIKILSDVNKNIKVKFHIIGDGESKEKLFCELKKNNIEYKFYGKIYDKKVKKEIFNQCRFGINIMKKNVCVGLTMKSIDYFKLGLPIINNIECDTKNIVDYYEVGININKDNIEEVSKKIRGISLEELKTMKYKCGKLYEKLFSYGAFENSMNLIIRELKYDEKSI